MKNSKQVSKYKPSIEKFLKNYLVWLFLVIICFIIALLFLNPNSNWQQISIGMTKSKVLSLIGQPERKVTLSGYEYWCYGLKEDVVDSVNLGIKAYTGYVRFALKFENDKVLDKYRHKLLFYSYKM